MGAARTGTRTVTKVDRAPVAHLIFSLDQQLYALAIDYVVEVAAMVELLRTPSSDEVFLGAANRHGAVLPVLDLRPILRQPAAPIDTSTLFIVARSGGQQVGLVVDEVLRIQYFDLEQVAQGGSRDPLVQGIITHGEHLIQMVALPVLLAQHLPLDVPAYFEGTQAT